MGYRQTKKNREFSSHSMTNTDRLRVEVNRINYTKFCLPQTMKSEKYFKISSISFKSPKKNLFK